jgi:hypothetical protein
MVQREFELMVGDFEFSYCLTTISKIFADKAEVFQL